MTYNNNSNDDNDDNDDDNNNNDNNNIIIITLVITGASQRLEPVIKCSLFLSFFQCLVSRAPLSAVTKSLS